MPSLLQPVAHALLQAREELFEIMNTFSERLLWERPAGVASPAKIHLRTFGYLDRLLLMPVRMNSDQLYALIY